MKLSERAHQIVGWQTRRMAGYEMMTCTQFLLLSEMKANKDKGWRFVDLSSVHGATVKSLENRGWIFASKGIDGIKHGITGLGEKALKAYSAPVQSYRNDGICPRCGKRERRVRKTGELAPYCGQCESFIQSNRWQKGLTYRNPGICPMCNKRDKHIPESGIPRPYCKPCNRKRLKQEKKRANERNLTRIAQGEILHCYRCKAEPREVVNGRVRDYCPDCRREYMREYNTKRGAA